MTYPFLLTTKLNCGYQNMSDEQSIPYPAFNPNRVSLELEVGVLVKYESDVFQITQLVDYQSVMGVSATTGLHKLLRIEELSSAKDSLGLKEQDEADKDL